MGAHDQTSLDGRVALVTGSGSSEGIGFATARIMGTRGASVAIASTTDRIHERVEELAAAGIEAIGLVADLVDPEQAERLAREVEEQLGPLDALVNNAGMTQVGEQVQAADFLEGEPGAWRRDIDLNLAVTANVIRAAAPGMVGARPRPDRERVLGHRHARELPGDRRLQRREGGRRRAHASARGGARSVRDHRELRGARLDRDRLVRADRARGRAPHAARASRVGPTRSAS